MRGTFGVVRCQKTPRKSTDLEQYIFLDTYKKSNSKNLKKLQPSKVGPKLSFFRKNAGAWDLPHRDSPDQTVRIETTTRPRGSLGGDVDTHFLNRFWWFPMVLEQIWWFFAHFWFWHDFPSAFTGKWDRNSKICFYRIQGIVGGPRFRGFIFYVDRSQKIHMGFRILKNQEFSRFS